MTLRKTLPLAALIATSLASTAQGADRPLHSKALTLSASSSETGPGLSLSADLANSSSTKGLVLEGQYAGEGREADLSIEESGYGRIGLARNLDNQHRIRLAAGYGFSERRNHTVDEYNGKRVDRLDIRAGYEAPRVSTNATASLGAGFVAPQNLMNVYDLPQSRIGDFNENRLELGAKVALLGRADLDGLTLSPSIAVTKASGDFGKNTMVEYGASVGGKLSTESQNHAWTLGAELFAQKTSVSGNGKNILRDPGVNVGGKVFVGWSLY